MKPITIALLVFLAFLCFMVYKSRHDTPVAQPRHTTTTETPHIYYTCDDYTVKKGALNLLGLENESIRDVTTIFSSKRGCSCKGYIHGHTVHYDVELTDAGRPILTANLY